MPKKILVLEDNQDILDVVHETLVYEGFEVYGTTKAGEIMPFAKKLLPDLVILDFRVAYTNGGEICRQIKADPILGKIPVIIFSAYINNLSELSAYGCDAIIYKPFDLDELTARINTLIK